MSSDNPNPEQAQAKIALALGRLRGDVMPPVTSQAAPRLQDPMTPTAPAPAPASASSVSGGPGLRAEPSFNPPSSQPAQAATGPTLTVTGGPVANSLNTNLSTAGRSGVGLGSAGIGNGAGVTPPQPAPGSAAASQPTASQPAPQLGGAQPTTSSAGSLGNNASGSNYFGNINVPKSDQQPDLLAGVDMGPPPLGDGYPRAEDDEARRKRNRRVVLIGAAAAVVVILGFWIGTRNHGDVPVITADATPEKVKPADQGGLQVPNQNVQVLENMNGQPKVQGSETVLPPPEQPMAPPAPAVQTDQNAAAANPAAAPANGSDQSVQVPAVPTPGTETSNAASATGSSAPAAPAVPAVPAVPDSNSSAMTSTAAVPAAPATTAPATTTASAATTTKTAPAAPATTTTTEPAAKSTAPAATPGGKVRVQLAAVKSEAAAKSTWAKLQKAHPSQLGNLSLIIEKVDKGTEGIFYRVQAGPLADKAAAKSICSALAQQNQACLVAH